MRLLQMLRAWFRGDSAADLEAAIRLHESGDLAGAELRYRAMLQADASNADAMHLLGLIAHQRGEHAAAVAQIRAAIALKSDKATYHYNLGNALAALDRAQEAVESFRVATRLDPVRSDARSNLAHALSQAGRHQEAVLEFRQLLGLQTTPAARNALASALVRCADADPAAARNYDEAAGLLQQSWQDADDPVEGRLALAYCLQQCKRWTEAAEHYEAVLLLQPENTTAHNNLANCYNQLGRVADAILHYRETYRLAPDFPEALASVLACLNYDPECSPEQAAAEHRNWAEQAASRYYPMSPRFDNDRDPERRLRIGYISPDFRRHPVSAIFAPILAAHDRDRLEVSCYYNYAGEDAITLQLKSLAGHWRPIVAMSDEKLCEQIRSDRIDILVDLAGHTTHNRLLAFARKPAPVQVSWLGYFNTTGLATMDYFISDPWSSPAGQERYYVERVLRLRHTRFCYQPPEYMPALSPLPAQTSGHITFGCLNNLSKLNEQVLALWGRVLRAVPESRLLVQAAALDDAPNRARFSALCAKHGIAPERLTLRGFSPIEQSPASYAEIDIALDPFPFCGGMTSLEALWLGVPVITLAGETIASRQSASMLMNLGLPELIAEDAAQYVAAAAGLAQDLPRLSALRAGMRQRYAACPLMDYAGFARELEQSYRDMWLKWTASGEAVTRTQNAG
ncbi:MAG: tetratricopeptide repeat protein [Burkholderiales bacterium]|nr:tetratricopeptide repeat protein [Burkholderiales bacterium]